MKKRGSMLPSDMSGWIIFGVVVLVIMFGAYMVLNGKADGAMRYVQNIFKFGYSFILGVL